MQKWVTIKAAKSGGKEVKLGTKGEGEIPLHLIGKVAILPTEAFDITDKKQVTAKLKEIGIEFDGRKPVEELAALLPDEYQVSE